MAGAGALGLLLVVLLPEAAHAWGPATHVYLGLELLGSLDLIAAPTAALLSAHPVEFLYGSVAADIPLGKQYADDERHPHAWNTGWEMYEAAGGDSALRAAAVGYLTHLAADANAHEVFVPRMLLLTASSKGVGHSYWEHRMDAGLAPAYMDEARELVTVDGHDEADRLFSTVKSRTLFSFDTNRQLFEGLVQLSYGDGWQNIFDTVLDNSRWTLRREERRRYLSHSFEAVVGFLRQQQSAPVASEDPIGKREIPEAKQVRRRVLRDGGWRDPEVLEGAAEELFPLPDGETPLWEARTPPDADPEVRLEVPVRLVATPAGTGELRGPTAPAEPPAGAADAGARKPSVGAGGRPLRNGLP